MTSRTARCHCGQLELRCEGEPKKISMCHCLDCQRRTGSAFSVAVFYVRDRVTVAKGTSRTFERDAANGFRVTFYFCGTCGANVYWETARSPQVIGVALGAFADPSFPQPEQSVWTRDKHAWISLPHDMATYDVAHTPEAPSR